MSEPKKSQSAVVEFLSRPDTYGQAGAVEVHRTHGSYVFLGGASAYKLKRDVHYPYMDYSTPALRKAMCLKELALNRQIAPSLYNRVRGVACDQGTARFVDTDDPAAVDWVVEMRRFDQANLLETRRRSGTLELKDVIALADAIAVFHDNAQIVIDQGGVEGMRAVIDENVPLLKEGFQDQPRRLADLEQLFERWLLKSRGLLGWRRCHGSVRRCHGDLHLNNIVLEDGAPILFDAIEFNDAFSCIDTLYDLAFPIMDLDSHGLCAHANVLLNRYLERRPDHAGLAVLPLFLSCRAAIRAHVSVAAGEAKPNGTHLLKEAIRYLEPPKAHLVAIGGVSGTGKSSLARLLAPELGAAPGALILRSDAIRKSLFDVAPEVSLPASAYEKSVSADVYGRMFDYAETALKAGHTVILDAVFGDETERAAALKVAQMTSVPFQPIWLEAPEAILAARVQARRGDASDADTSVVKRQVGSVTVPAGWWKQSASGSLVETAAAVRQLLLG